MNILRRVLDVVNTRLLRGRVDYVQHTPSTGGGEVSLKLFAPNKLAHWRNQTFSTKEPETLAWIDNLDSQGPLLDVGANVGLYSLYFAKIHRQKVLSFEPSVFNLPTLVRNVALNGLGDSITVFPVALTNRDGAQSLSLSSTEEASALSSFGVTFGHDGEEFLPEMQYRLPGFRFDSLVDAGLVDEFPVAVKIDVDGIEHLVLEGMKKSLADPRIRSILIEVNTQFQAQYKRCRELLTSAGFTLTEESHSDLIDSGSFSSTYNQIWAKAANHF